MNRTLLIGLMITVAMIAASFFGQYFTTHDLGDQVDVHYSVDANGQGNLIVPPVSPNAEYPFGTDKAGNDLMVKLIDGSKYTILVSLAVAFTRICLGGILGLFLGYFGKDKTHRGKRLPIWNVLNGIPIFIIVWMVMIGLSINPAASPFDLTLFLAVVMTIVGIPSVASTVRDKTMVIREKQFIISARSIGAGPVTIIRTHILPHLKESLIILFVQEIVLILGLMGQLAIFNIFVGGSLMYFDPFEYVSRTNEWTGLIGQARNYLFIYQWILLIPLAAYIIFIFGFHLISVGLESIYKEKYSKVSHI
ncbi:ABC transporter permease [Paenibacillus guangzhouensis]|uniref:ABC transporter permease n=1 Tax=Paenibacillus guangzhouensis TaxID=1473112 RepID=UPI0012668B74|nr:ABC transporter permease subunit [Paenibacillus guangzhouensis]